MHITTHAIVDRNKSVTALIKEGADLSIELQRHYALLSNPVPEYGQFAWRATRTSNRQFNREQLYNLSKIGHLLMDVDKKTEGLDKKEGWKLGIFVVRTLFEFGRDLVEDIHLQGIGENTESGGSQVPSSVYEVGIGHLSGERDNKPLVAAASVVLRSVIASEIKQDILSVRTYIKRGKGFNDELMCESSLPDEEECKDFLQLHRDAMWDSVSEPI